MAKESSSLVSFDYIAKTPNNEFVKESLKAPSKDKATAALLERGYTVYEIKEGGGGGLSMEINIGKKLPKLKDLATWTRQLSIMINAGVSLIEALDLIGSENDNAALKDASLDLVNGIKSGSNLAESMRANENGIFPIMMINMVAAAEVAGNLDIVLKEVADTLEADARLKAKIKSAMTYPVAVLIMTALITVVLLVFVVPTFQAMFDSLGGELPLPTQILVNMSTFLQYGSVPVVIAIIGFRIWWKKNRQEQWFRDVWEPFTLKLPVFGMLMTKVAIGRFTRNLGRLLASGVPLLEALGIVRDTSGNVVIERAVDGVSLAIKEGSDMASELKNHPIFPAMVVAMVKTGEETGNMDGMLDKISDVYEDEVNTTTDALTSLMEPILIAILGSVVGSIIIALYMPIFSIIDVVGESG